MRRSPRRTEALNLAKRFRDHGPYYFTFLDRPGVEPTNNGIEQQFRFLIVDRKVTQGTRGEAGRRWCERIWTALATCAQRGRSAFVYLTRTLKAYFFRPGSAVAPGPAAVKPGTSANHAAFQISSLRSRL